MTLEEQVAALTARVNALEVENGKQQRMLIRTLIDAAEGKTAVDLVAEVRGRIYPFFREGAEKNEKFVRFLEGVTANPLPQP